MRKAGPWRRKMSATSRALWPMVRSLRGSQGFQWTDHFAQDFGGHLGVQRRGVQALVSQQHLDHADVLLLFQQMRDKGMSQAVHGDSLVNFGDGGGIVHGTVELAGAQRFKRVQTRKQPAAHKLLALGVCHTPPNTQAITQYRGSKG